MRASRITLPLIFSLIAPAMTPVHARTRPVTTRTVTTRTVTTTTMTSSTVAASNIAAKLELYQRLLEPGGGTYNEISGFMAQNPDWPQQNLLAQRREEAMSAITDPTSLLDACHDINAQQAGTLARCAAAESAEPVRAARDASAAWARGYDDPTLAADFLQQFGGMITPAAEWQRYARLLSENPKRAARQLARLGTAQRRLASVLLAFRQNDPDATELAAALPVSDQTDPSLFLAWMSNLLHAGDDKGALALWRQNGPAAQDAALHRLGDFWNARNQLARALMADSDAADAYDLVKAPGALPPDRIVDAEFLAGWIALRKLSEPDIAIGHFNNLALNSDAVITLARAHYWLGRAYAAKGDDGNARAQYLDAAQYPYAYYGQLAVKALHYSDADLAARINAMHDPAVNIIRANALAGTEMARAAQILVDQGNNKLARIFLQRLAATATDPSSKVAAAYLANTLGLPDQALSIARQAAVQGVLMPDLGWPTPITPPNLDNFDPAFTLAIARQESNFNPDAQSPVGAIGLMQLMPDTARALARHLKIRHLRIAALTQDPSLNLELGSVYLQQLMDHFDQTVPFAAAAYNAGPERVAQWLQQYGDPTTDKNTDMIDWIEQIPFSETRNYVQRVTENLTIYRARTGHAAGYPIAQLDATR